MPEGFFSLSTLTQKSPPPLLPRCGQCQLYKHCKSPKMPPSGKGRKRILICGEAPGETEDEEGLQFVGKSGRYLQRVLNKFGIDMRRDCWITNAVICRPESNILPKQAADHCQPNLTKTLRELKPDVIITLGAVPTKSLLSLVWKENVGGISKWAGFCIPCHEPNAWIVPTFHPSYCERMQDPVVDMFFERHIQLALEKEGKPWEEIPKWEKEVQCILDPKEAAEKIHGLIESPFVAWDLETNTLKPDSKKSQIVCCALSDGITTIAFPWYGVAIKAMHEFIRSDTPKGGYNLKFESRWTNKEFGCRVKNWYWDGMIGAHVLDNRPGITSLKFQSFVRLGQQDYNTHIHPYLKSKGSNLENRIKEIEIMDLLRYCGMDALLEWKVDVLQMKEMNYPLPEGVE